jgi:hypothetical protein
MSPFSLSRFHPVRVRRHVRAAIGSRSATKNYKEIEPTSTARKRLTHVPKVRMPATASDFSSQFSSHLPCLPPPVQPVDMIPRERTVETHANDAVAPGGSATPENRTLLTLC